MRDDRRAIVIPPQAGIHDRHLVIPAKAGIHYATWIPAFAGMTEC